MSLALVRATPRGAAALQPAALLEARIEPRAWPAIMLASNTKARISRRAVDVAWAGEPRPIAIAKGGAVLARLAPIRARPDPATGVSAARMGARTERTMSAI